MANLVSLKLSPKEANAEYADPAGATLPEYSYGTIINLCDEEIKKLGINEMPAVGQVMMIEARVEVCSVSAYENQASTERNIGLQITDMAITSGNGPKSAAEKIFNKK